MKLRCQPLSLLWQRNSSDGNSRLDNAVTDCASVSQVNQGAGEDDDGAETETDGTAATTEELNECGRVV
jgi:hypothetical protein